MFVVYKYVRDVEQKALQYKFLVRLQGQNKKKTMKRPCRVMMQGILYSVTMLMLYIFGSIYIIALKIA